MYNRYKLVETILLSVFFLAFGLEFFNASLHVTDENCIGLKKWGHFYGIFA
jgi:hypothetical protein